MSVCSSRDPELIALLGKAAATPCPTHLYPPKAKISNYCSAENVNITQLFIIPGFVIFHMFYSYLLALEKTSFFLLRSLICRAMQSPYYVLITLSLW